MLIGFPEIDYVSTLFAFQMKLNSCSHLLNVALVKMQEN